jgi:hypothetical protein
MSMGNGLEDIAKFGSPSALSLLASAGSTPIPALIIGGALLAVTASVFAYKKYEKYEEKKHKQKIEEIIRIYDEKLKKIDVPFLGSIDGFPPVFQLTKDGHYESLHYNLAEIRDVGRLLPSEGDVALVDYRESIRSALRKLKEYYYLRVKSDEGESDEISTRVISYLLHMIDTKCLNFLGYEYDIAYLGALTEFINTYASLSGEHSQHFDRLKEVYTNLLGAKQKLEKHKEFLSLEETVSALRDHCIQHSDLMIRSLVKMVVGEDDTEFADTVNHDELIDGILRKHYIRSSLWGIEIRADHRIDIPDAVFKEWIKNLSIYFLSSLNVEFTKKTHNIPPYESFFSFIDKALTYLANKATAPSDTAAKNAHDSMKKQLSLITEVFHKSDNFISTVYRSSDKKFHLVKDEDQIVERTKIVANFAKLIDDVISLQYLCIHLSKSIKELGEIYVKNPQHFRKIFGAVHKLCALIQEDVKTCQDDFTNLQLKNKDQMQVAKKEQFPIEVKRILEALAQGINRFGDEIDDCRKKAENTVNKDTIVSVSYDMLEVAKSILGRYSLSIDMHGPRCLNLDDRSYIKPVPAEVKPIDPVKVKDSSSQDTKPVILKPTPSISGNKGNSALPDIVKTPPAQKEPFTQLKDLTQEIYSKIVSISGVDKNASKNYIKLYDSLMVMQEKSIALSNEENKSEERTYKAEKTLEITLALAKKVADFFEKKPEERKQEAVSFAKEIHTVLSNEENSDFIDVHKNALSRYIHTHLCTVGLFKTDTRKKFNDFDEACSKLCLG